MSDVTARVLGACAAPVASLNLAHCVHITHVGVAALAPLKSTLTALDLTGCFRVGDDGVDAVLRLTGVCTLPPYTCAGACESMRCVAPLIRSPTHMCAGWGEGRAARAFTSGDVEGDGRWTSSPGNGSSSGRHTHCAGPARVPRGACIVLNCTDVLGAIRANRDSGGRVSPRPPTRV